MKKLKEKLSSYHSYYNEINKESEVWKGILNENEINTTITLYEKQQYIHVISSIYEVEFKRLYGSGKSNEHKNIMLKKGAMDVTPIIMLTWELNNGLKHGKIDRKKMNKLLKNKCFEILLEYALDNCFNTEIYDLICFNPVLFDFSPVSIPEEQNKEISNALITYSSQHEEANLFDKVLQIIEDYKIIEASFKSYIYANDNYDNWHKHDVMRHFRKEIEYLPIIPEYMDEGVYFKIIYFFNNLLLHLIENNSIEFYKKVVETSYVKIQI